MGGSRLGVLFFFGKEKGCGCGVGETEGLEGRHRQDGVKEEACRRRKGIEERVDGSPLTFPSSSLR